MTEEYYKYYEAFKNLDVEDKKKELSKNLHELTMLLYQTNNKLLEENNALPIIGEYKDDDEYLNHLFTYIISLKEENAKLIEYAINK